MKRIVVDIVFLAIFLAGLGFALRDPLRAWLNASQRSASPEHGRAPSANGSSAPASGARKVLYYQDAMNPVHRSDKPGTDSMGMPLNPVYAEESESPSNMAAGTVKISAQKQQLIGVSTAKVERLPIQRTIRTVAQLQADETRIAHIHVKVNGWIDQVYVDFIGKLVKKGQPLFTLYSPDLVGTQREYLIARRGQRSLGASPLPDVSRGADSLFEAARERLRLWDISDDQIQKLDETGEVMRTLTLYSPINGFVLDRKAFPQVAVNPDMDLYAVADLSTIWAAADVYQYEVPYVRVGQGARMTLDYLPGKSFLGKVSYIYPTVDPQTRTVKIRIEFANPGFALKPGMFSEVELRINYGTQIVVPLEAVLDSGTQQTVFVARDNGYFEPRQVQIGARLEDKLIVLDGLRPGETIVTSGNFLIDSESRLKSAMGGMKP